MATKRERDKQTARKSKAREWAAKQGQSSDSACLNLPEGVEFYKLKEGIEKLDFMSWIAGEGNPRADEGEECFNRMYEVHWVTTAQGRRPVSCRKYCFGRKCAVCNWLVKHGATADPETVKSLRAKRRHLWLVRDKLGDPKAPFKVLETGDKNKGAGFAEVMSDAINSLDEDVEDFTSLESGLTAVLTVKPQTGGEFKYLAATRIDFKPRKYTYPETLLKKAPCLDKIIVDPGYEEVMELLETGGPEDEAEDEADPERNGDTDDDTPARGKSKAKSQVEEPDDEDGDGDGDDPTAEDLDLNKGDKVLYQNTECTITKVSGDGTSLTLKDDEDGGTYNAVAPSKVKKIDGDEESEDSEEDEDSDPPPKKGGGKKTSTKHASTTGKRGSDPDEEEDEDEEESDSILEDDDEDSEESEDEDDLDAEDEDDDDEPEPPKKKKRRK
jgi:hypothetical protein